MFNPENYPLQLFHFLGKAKSLNGDLFFLVQQQIEAEEHLQVVLNREFPTLQFMRFMTESVALNVKSISADYIRHSSIINDAS